MKNRYENLYKIIDEIKPRCILEVGTHNGVTARKMVKQALIHGHKEPIIYYGFDLWEDLTQEQKEYEHCGKPVAEIKIARKNLNIPFCQPCFYQGNTKDTLKRFTDESNEKFIDFAFIDGGHHQATIKADWENVRKVMKKRGVVVFDDLYSWPSIQEENYDIGCNRTIHNIIVKGQDIVTFLDPLDSDPNEIHKIRMIKVLVR